MVKLIEIYPQRKMQKNMANTKFTTTWHICDVEIQTSHIILVRAEEHVKSQFAEDNNDALKALPQGQEFSKITLSNSTEIIVFGSLAEVKEKIIRDNKKVLHG